LTFFSTLRLTSPASDLSGAMLVSFFFSSVSLAALRGGPALAAAESTRTATLNSRYMKVLSSVRGGPVPWTIGVIFLKEPVPKRQDS